MEDIGTTHFNFDQERSEYIQELVNFKDTHKFHLDIT